MHHVRAIVFPSVNRVAKKDCGNARFQTLSGDAAHVSVA
ncbi:hypothetical protein L579_2788 [Pantoea sp. AS-PWVM4]|nr:hypothetical protein L579_2788 [Pantoea sp. AS-PWVM4]